MAKLENMIPRSRRSKIQFRNVAVLRIPSHNFTEFRPLSHKRTWRRSDHGVPRGNLHVMKTTYTDGIASGAGGGGGGLRTERSTHSIRTSLFFFFSSSLFTENANCFQELLGLLLRGPVIVRRRSVSTAHSAAALAALGV